MLTNVATLRLHLYIFLALNVHVGAQSQWERHDNAYFTEKIAAFDKALFKN